MHIVGTPALAARETGATLHHNLPGRDYGHFARMAAEVTAAQADLRPDTAPEEIDRVLSTALRTSRPVYLTIPADVAGIPVLAPAGRLPRAAGTPIRPSWRRSPGAPAGCWPPRPAPACWSATSPPGTGSPHRSGTWRSPEIFRWPCCQAKGDFPESDPRFAGLYAGPASAKRARVAVEDADVLITVGVTLADTVLAARISCPRAAASTWPRTRPASTAPSTPASACASRWPFSPRRSGPCRPAPPWRTCRPSKPRRMSAAAAHPAQPVGPRAGPPAPGDLLIADQGTAFYGAAGLTLPDGARLVGQPLWASIGWALPAALGASLAAPDRRVVLIAGDGAMQQTAAELGTLLGQGLAPIVIVLSNGGYTIERAIHRPSAGYHEIPAWDWTALPAAVAPASSPVALRVETSDELAWALNAAQLPRSHGPAVLIEAVLGAEDAPPLLQDLTRALAAPTGEGQPPPVSEPAGGCTRPPRRKRTSHARHRRPGRDPSRRDPHARPAGPGLRQLDAAGTGRRARGGA